MNLVSLLSIEKSVLGTLIRIFLFLKKRKRTKPGSYDFKDIKVEFFFLITFYLPTYLRCVSGSICSGIPIPQQHYSI